MIATPDMLEHQPYCLPRPGESVRRMESYAVPRYGSDGIAVIGSALVVRCVECGNRTVDGHLVRD